MTKMNKNQDNKLFVPHDSREITFALPGVGPGMYQENRKKLLGRGLRIPTGDEVASLLHAIYCNPEIKNKPEGISEIEYDQLGETINIFNINLWTSKGTYILQDLKASGSDKNVEIDDLESMLIGGTEIEGIRFSKDKRVRFAPKDTHILGEQDPEKIAENGLIIANYGIEGAKKISEVASIYLKSSKVANLSIYVGGWVIEEK